MADEFMFYTHPQSRGRIVRWMPEEIGQPYRTEILAYRAAAAADRKRRLAGRRNSSYDAQDFRDVIVPRETIQR